jgi:D-glycero-alpha-D-manno-heptose 1-phosphate guanylyltransferase
VEAIILAGGLGTRLRSVIADLPKPMAPIAGKPFLWYLLSYMSSFDIQKVILSVGYQYEIIQASFGHRFAGMEIQYAVEEEPLGTGGGIRHALKKVHGERVLIVNGDTFFAVDFSELAKTHSARNADLTLSLKPMMNFNRYGNVVTAETRVIGFQEKQPTQSGLINGGIYLMNSHLFDELALHERFSFEKDFLEKFVRTRNFQAFISDGYFIDIGVPEDYLAARQELQNKLNVKG